MENNPEQSAKVHERQELVSAPNADTFISVGQICMFMHSVFVMVTSLCLDGMVKCQAKVVTVVNGRATSFDEHCEIACALHHLSEAKVTMSDKMQAAKREFWGRAQELSQVFSNKKHTDFVALCGCGLYLRELIQNALKKKEIKTNLTVLPVDVLIKYLGLTKTNNFSKEFTVDNDIALLDGVLGGRWDIFERTDKQSFKFIRSITFKLVGPILKCNITKSSTSVPLSDNYRASAVESLHVQL